MIQQYYCRKKLDVGHCQVKIKCFTFVMQGGNDIPVKEILDLMQADPAFDVLFSVFGLGECEFFHQ